MASGIGARIKEERERRKWRQEDLATYAGISTRTVVNIENSEGEGSGAQMGTLQKIQKALGVPILLHDMVNALENGMAKGKVPEKEGDTDTEKNIKEFALNCRAIVDNAANISEKDMATLRNSLEWVLDRIRGLDAKRGERVPDEDID